MKDPVRNMKPGVTRGVIKIIIPQTKLMKRREFANSKSVDLGISSSDLPKIYSLSPGLDHHKKKFEPLQHIMLKYHHIRTKYQHVMMKYQHVMLKYHHII